jgi:hypothetical protein
MKTIISKQGLLIIYVKKTLFQVSVDKTTGSSLHSKTEHINIHGIY